MTPLLKYTMQQDDDESTWAEPSWREPDCSASTFWQDVRETQRNFWEETAVPVFRVLSQTVSVLSQEAWARLTNIWQSSGFHLARQSDSAKPVKASTSIKAFRSANAMPVWKVHGALGVRWTNDVPERPIRVTTGKQNPWMVASKRPAPLRLNQFSRAENDIRGLDDIFTTPVQGSFLDVIQGSGGRTGRKGSVVKPSTSGSETRKSVPQNKVPEKLPEKAATVSPKKVDRMTTLVETQERLKAESQKLGKRVKSVADSTKDWFTRQENLLSEMSEQLSDKIPSPYQSYVAEEEPVFAPVAPPLPVLKPTDRSGFNRTNTSPQKESYYLSAEPPRVHREVAGTSSSGADFNGFDYMVQNNRILANSISNLVDSYFDQAALSEDSA